MGKQRIPRRLSSERERRLLLSTAWRMWKKVRKSVPLSGSDGGPRLKMMMTTSMNVRFHESALRKRKNPKATRF
jgi:hypothetical protein